MKEARHKRTHARFHLYEMSRIDKATRTEQKWVAARGLAGGLEGCDCIMNVRFF